MDQVLAAGYPSLVNVAADRYNTIQGGYLWTATAANRIQLISDDGVIKSLFVELDGAPGNVDAEFYDFTLLVNGAPTALTVKIKNLETSASDAVNEIDVAAGDMVSILCEPSPGAPDNARNVFWSMIYTGDTAKHSQIMGIGNAATAFDGFFQVMDSNINNGWIAWTDVSAVIPTGGKIKRLFVELTADPGVAPEAYKITLLKGGVATALTCTITANNVAGNDVANEVAVAAEDRVCLYIEGVNAPTVDSIAYFGLTFEADIDGEAILLGSSNDNLPTVATEFNGPISAQWGDTWLIGESVSDQLLQTATTLKKLYLELSGAPGADTDYTFQIRLNGGASVLEVVIADAAVKGNNVNEIVIADWDRISLRVVPTGPPTGRDAYWGMVMGGVAAGEGGGYSGGVVGAGSVLLLV